MRLPIGRSLLLLGSVLALACQDVPRKPAKAAAGEPIAGPTGRAQPPGLGSSTTKTESEQVPSAPPTPSLGDLVVAPPSEHSSGCDLAKFGATDRAIFESFFESFRAAVASGRPERLAPFVEFPLHARNGCSCPSIADRGEFIAGFDRIFTAEVRRVVADQRMDQLNCKAAGVMYGNGKVWVGLVAGETPERYGVTQVSVGECDPRPPGKRVTLLRCVTDRRWHHVDWTGRQYRYRSGALGSTKPSRTLLGGIERTEGTWPYRHDIWTFQTDSGVYQLSDMISSEDSTPENQVGTFAELKVDQEIGFPWKDCLAP